MVQAKFFDGNSSKPHSIKLSINDIDKSISFRSESNLLQKWYVEDLYYENIGSYVEIHNKKSKVEFIKVDDREFVSAFFGLLKSADKLTFYQKLINLGFKKHIIIALFIMVVIALGYFTVLPWIAEKATLMIPESFDNKLGDSFMSQYVNDIDSVKTIQLNQFASKLKWNNKKKIHFTVVKSDVVNAFALPNGEIVVYTEIIDKMKSYDELVGLIGHEVTHINNRHSIKMLSRNLAGYLFISAVFSDVNGIMTIISENVHNLSNLSYSRHFENEADYDGTLLIIQNQVDPNGMIKLFERLNKEKKIAIPAFISTHPYTEKRIESIKKLIKTQKFNIKDHPEEIELFNKMKGKQ